MTAIIQLSPETYQLLQRRAKEARITPEQVAETAIRLQLGNTTHIEQRMTRSGLQAYIRGTRVAVRHVAAFLDAGHTAEVIVQNDLPHVAAAAIHEAIAYYFDHRTEIEAELAANTPEAVSQQFQQRLTPAQYHQLTT